MQWRLGLRRNRIWVCLDKRTTFIWSIFLGIRADERCGWMVGKKQNTDFFFFAATTVAFRVLFHHSLLPSVAPSGVRVFCPSFACCLLSAPTQPTHITTDRPVQSPQSFPSPSTSLQFCRGTCLFQSLLLLCSSTNRYFAPLALSSLVTGSCR